MAAEVTLGLMVDRRQPGSDRRLPADLHIVSQVDLDGAEPGVWAWLVRSPGSGSLPEQVVSPGFGVQVRLMDRFYLPEVRDPDLIRTMFDLIADLYDRITAHEVNLSTSRELLDQVLDGVPPTPVILDFGCGTGIAIEALASLGAEAHLLGVDLSTAMLRRAAARGEAVLSATEWRSAPPAVDGAIASFVLHYGVPKDDLIRIARCLLPGCAFAANLFGGSPEEVQTLAQELALERLELTRRAELGGTRTANILLTFRKQR